MSKADDNDAVPTADNAAALDARQAKKLKKWANGRCSRKVEGRSGLMRPCNRQPLWRINYLGGFCNTHFEDYLTTHNVDPDDVTRLSDDEADFVVKAEEGRGYFSRTLKRLEHFEDAR